MQNIRVPTQLRCNVINLYDFNKKNSDLNYTQESGTFLLRLCLTKMYRHVEGNSELMFV